MALPNPLFIDQSAQHLASGLRTLNYTATRGQQGVLEPTDLAVQALTTAGGSIRCAPGVYAVNNTAVGGSRQAYVGEFDVEEVVSVSPTDASGGRTDLVICRIENPYAVGTGGGSGGWAAPPDELNGPYSHIRVVEGVSANLNSVTAHSTEWTAIPLARITRPANTGVVEQSHITDLRSLVDLSGERIEIIVNPPATAPPIAQEWHTANVTSVGVTDTGASTSFGFWPPQVDVDVPVPSWAREVDFDVVVQNWALILGDVFGEARLLIDGAATITRIYDANRSLKPDGTDNPTRQHMHLGGTYAVPSAARGRVVKLRVQTRSFGVYPGRLRADTSTNTKIALHFKRHPS